MKVHITSKGSGGTTEIVDSETGEQLRRITEIHFDPIRSDELVRCSFVTRATIDVEAEVYEPRAECVRLRAEIERLRGAILDEAIWHEEFAFQSIAPGTDAEEHQRRALALREAAIGGAR